MYQVRIHSYGGQRVVNAAELFARAFPRFGFEHTGAHVVAFCRIADSEIRPGLLRS